MMMMMDDDDDDDDDDELQPPLAVSGNALFFHTFNSLLHSFLVFHFFLYCTKPHSVRCHLTYSPLPSKGSEGGEAKSDTKQTNKTPKGSFLHLTLT